MARGFVGIYCVDEYFVLYQGENDMSIKTETEVVIGGKSYTLSGSESAEYLQRVAFYINNKLSEYNKIESFRKQSSEFRNILLELNIADDLFKAKQKIVDLEEELERKEKELYDLKHELISSQIKLDNAEKSVKSLQSEVNDNTKKIVRLEAQIKGANA